MISPHFDSGPFELLAVQFFDSQHCRFCRLDLHETVVLRVKSKPVETKKDALEGELDSSFEDAGYWLASAMLDQGRKKEARDMYKAWSRLRCGSPDLREECKRKVKELKS